MGLQGCGCWRAILQAWSLLLLLGANGGSGLVPSDHLNNHAMLALRLEDANHNGAPLTTQLPSASCPAGCRCRFGLAYKELDCSDAGFLNIPTDIPETATSLNLAGNNIELKAGSFAHLRSLEALSLARAGLHRLPNGAFNHMPRLGLLDLNNNVLNGFANSPFANLSRLSALNLSGNVLSSLGEKDFIGLTNLTALDLSDNNLGHIESTVFQSLKSLELLDLSGNILSNLSGSWFADMKSLNTLRVNRNRIANLECGAFRHLVALENLELSSNELKSLDSNCFAGLERLKRLELQDNDIGALAQEVFIPLTSLEFLNLSANLFDSINHYQFKANTHLLTLSLRNMPHLSVVLQDSFSGLKNLRYLLLSDNPSLRYIEPKAFTVLSSLQHLDISGNDLRTLHQDSFTNFAHLKSLALHGNPWICDCNMLWFPQWFNSSVNTKIILLAETKCAGPPSDEESKIILDANDVNLNCSDASIVHHSLDGHFRLGATALLECEASGNPAPTITWILPRNNAFVWEAEKGELHRHTTNTLHGPTPKVAAPENGTQPASSLIGQPKKKSRVRVLRNGNLYISRVLSADAGTYLCVAANALAKDSASIPLKLDYAILIRVKIISILVGFATSFTALLILLICQLIKMALNRWGCCCCQDVVSPKAKQIRKMLETIEQYKSQQLDRLRDNYTMQSNRIKENCTQQMERIRESYTSQVERLRDIRDFGTKQLDLVRDQYSEQVKRVREYSMQQMNKVRENYLFQRTRVRKFSAHQLLRLRENYKLQQQHLNKILETLNLENCRTGCARTESLVFDADLTLGDALFTANLNELTSVGSVCGGRGMPRTDSDSIGEESNYFTPTNSGSPISGQYRDTYNGIIMSRAELLHSGEGFYSAGQPDRYHNACINQLAPVQQSNTKIPPHGEMMEGEQPTERIQTDDDNREVKINIDDEPESAQLLQNAASAQNPSATDGISVNELEEVVLICPDVKVITMSKDTRV